MSQRLRDLDDDERRLIGPYLTVERPSGNEYRSFCPECEDPAVSKSPSASFNFIRGEWHCMKNDCGGTVAKLMRKLLKRERDAQRSDEGGDVIDIATKRPIKPLPTVEQIQAYKDVLAGLSRLLSIITERRGVTEQTLDQFDIGYDARSKKYTIPVYGRDGQLTNMRVYNANAKGQQPKIMPFAVGYSTQLFNAKILDAGDEVVLCEGEWDAIVACQHGLPAMTHTGGAGSFQMSWAIEFKDKHVWICFDEDDGGRKGAIRTARMLQNLAAGVYIIGDLNTGKRSGDLSDFFMDGGTEDQFREMMESARLSPFAHDDSDHEPPTAGKKVTLEESQSTLHDEPLELDILIAGKTTPPYLAPKRIHAMCDQAKGKVCATCPMAAYNGDRTMETQADDPRLLDFIETNKIHAQSMLRAIFDARCPDRVAYDVMEQWPIEELVVVQSLDHRNEETLTPMHRKVFNVNTYRSSVNTTARVVGQQIADPRSNRGVFHSWFLEPVRSNIDEFTLDDETIEELAVFQPSNGQTPLEKCKEIAEDLSANVTQIYGRDLVHVAYDLVFHSALDFRFMGKRMDKGWLEAIVIGDTRTGKSETAKLLSSHYKAGIVKSCEGATFAGLVGGAQQSPQGKSWMVTWGTIPLNDRRLVVLDELSGMLVDGSGKSKGIIEQMSSIRSSGRAQLTKIVSEETSARTRLIWISNPIDGKWLGHTSSGGTSALRKLITNPEDIARFDFMIAVANGEVPSELINTTQHKKVEHLHDSDACAKLVMWAWSRKVDQIRFGRGSEEAIIKASEMMGATYIPDPPLIQVQNIREKLARIAVAIAARTFSTNRTGENIVVLPAHVAAAVEFLNWAYGTEAMGYLRESRRIHQNRIEGYANQIKVKDYLRKNIPMLEALRSVSGAPSFRPRDFDEFGSGEVDPKSITPMLLQWKLVRRLPEVGGRIVLEPPLLEVLKELEDEGV